MSNTTQEITKGQSCYEDWKTSKGWKMEDVKWDTIPESNRTLWEEHQWTKEQTTPECLLCKKIKKRRFYYHPELPGNVCGHCTGRRLGGRAS